MQGYKVGLGSLNPRRVTKKFSDHGMQNKVVRGKVIL
jgi:hypothetical protein